MIVPYSSVGHNELRPVLEIGVGSAAFRIRALVDSGSQNTLLPLWAAKGAGVDLASGDTRRLAVGGKAVEARFTTVLLTVAKFQWEAEVGFCKIDEIPFDGILGQQSFFRFFTIVFRGADREFEIYPISK
jgi:hypothetical protein